MTRLEEIKRVVRSGNDLNHPFIDINTKDYFWLIEKLENAIEMAKRIRSPEYNAEYQATEFLKELE